MRTVSPLISGSLAMVLALAAGACSRSEAVQPAPASDRGGANAIVPVATATVVDKAVPLQLSTIGTAEAYSNVAVRAQLTGELTAVLFKEGEDVRKGQVLFTLDRRPLEAALRQAKANLARDDRVSLTIDHDRLGGCNDHALNLPGSDSNIVQGNTAEGVFDSLPADFSFLSDGTTSAVIPPLQISGQPLISVVKETGHVQ